MRKFLFLSLLSFLFSLSCNQAPETTKEKNMDTTGNTISYNESIPFPGEVFWYKLKDGLTVRIEEEHPKGASLSNIRVFPPEAFEEMSPFVYEDKDPISDVMVADLDNNGFRELYIITQSAGSGSQGNVIALVSNEDKVLMQAKFPEMDAKDPSFVGYMGHDTYGMKDHFLVRTFPLYKSGDAQAAPTGGKRSLYYSLQHEGNEWGLVVSKTENS